MQKRVKIALVLVVLAIVGWVAHELLREPEPRYGGKGLREWLHDYGSGLNTEVPELLQAKKLAENAVRKMGTNAIPTLLRMIARKDSPIVSKLVGVWYRHYWSIPAWARHPGWYVNQAAAFNDEAALGFEILGIEAQQAVPALIGIYKQRISLRSQMAASRALNAIGPSAQRMAIPSFVQAVASSNAPERTVATFALYQIDATQADSRLVVPALIGALSDTNHVIRLVAARSLGGFGTNAEDAVPALVRLLSDPNLRVRPDATNALVKINPVAAAKAGVNTNAPGL